MDADGRLVISHGIRILTSGVRFVRGPRSIRRCLLSSGSSAKCTGTRCVSDSGTKEEKIRSIEKTFHIITDFFYRTNIQHFK